MKNAVVSTVKLALTSFFILMNDYNVDYLSCDIEWLLEHVAVTTNNIFTYLKGLTGKTIDPWSIFGRFFRGV